MNDPLSHEISKEAAIDRQKWLSNVFTSSFSSTNFVLICLLLEKLSDEKFKSEEFIEIMMQVWRATVASKLDETFKNPSEEDEELIEEMGIALEEERLLWDKESDKLMNIWLKSMKGSLEPFRSMLDPLMKGENLEE